MSVITQVRARLPQYTDLLNTSYKAGQHFTVSSFDGIRTLDEQKKQTVNLYRYDLSSISNILDSFELLDCAMDVISEFKLSSENFNSKRRKIKIKLKNHKSNYRKIIFNLYCLLHRVRNQIVHNRYTIGYNSNTIEIIDIKGKFLFDFEMLDVD